MTIKQFAKLYLSLAILGIIVFSIQRTGISLILKQVSLLCMLLYTGYVGMESIVALRDYVMDKIKGVKASD